MFNLLPACGPGNHAKGPRRVREYRATFGPGHLFWGERRAA